jgi:hypothetical protein
MAGGVKMVGDFSLDNFKTYYRIGIAGADGFWWKNLTLRRTAWRFLSWLILENIRTRGRKFFVLTGACPQGGIDLFAERVATSNGVPVILFPPAVHQWDDDGESQGYRTRNKWIVDLSDEIVVVEPFYRDYAHKGRALWENQNCSGGYWCYRYAQSIKKKATLVEISYGGWKFI